jgi:hypothetical protein
MWLMRAFAIEVRVARVVSREVDVMVEALSQAMEYFLLYPSAVRVKLDETAALVRLSDVPPKPLDVDPDWMWRLRLHTQNRVLGVHERDVGPGILMDVDNELAVRYFSIDCWLLGVKLQDPS